MADALGPLEGQGLAPEGHQVLSMLGEGTFAWVLATRDPQGRLAAVKVLKASSSQDPAGAWALAQEARLLARLPSSAFPAYLGEGHSLDGRPYLAMALAEGLAPEGPWGAAKAKQRLLALAQALEPLHALGWVHGDVKLDNLREDGAGRILVLDLGLASMAGQSRAELSGTPLTMAPEQWRRAPVDARADLYALGILAWTWVHGRPPWEGGPGELARAHLQSPPPPLASGDAALDFLVARLLAKEPGDRPPSAKALVAELLGRVPPEAAPPLNAAALVGLEGLLAAWQGGQPSPEARWLSGGPGSGKSSALLALQSQALAAGRAVAWAMGGGVPGQGGRSLVAAVARLSGQVPQGLAAAYLHDSLPAELANLDAPARLAALASAAARFLGEAAQELGGLALLVDEAGPEDAPTWSLLRALAGQQASGAPLALAAAGGGGAPGPAWVGESLGLWDLEALQAFAEARLGGPPPEGLLDALAPSQGLPRLAELLLADAASSGALHWQGGAWRFEASAATGLASGGALVAWAQERLRQASREEGALAKALAVAASAGPLPVSALAKALAWGEAEAQSLVASLVDRGLAKVASGQVALAFPGLAEAMLHRQGGTEVAELAAALARALQEQGPPAEASDLGRLVQVAELAAQGVQGPWVAPWLAQAGSTAFRSGAPVAAIQYLSAALALDDAPPALAATWRFTLAEALRAADRPAEAAEAYEQSLREGLNAAWAAAAGVGLAKARQLRGDYAGALDALAAASKAAETAGDPGLLARAHLAEARVRAFKGEGAHARALAEAAVAMAHAAHAEVVAGQALTLAGQLAAMAEPPEASEARAMLGEAVAIAQRLGDASGLAQALEGLGNVAMLAGDLDLAPQLLAEAEMAALGAGLATEALAARLNRALAAAERGEPEALALGAAVASAAQAVGRRFLVGAALVATALGALRLGRLAEAHEALTQAQILAEALGHALLAELSARVAFELALAEGDLQAAEAAEAALALHVSATQHAEGKAWLASLRAGLLRLQGQPEAAWRAAEQAATSAFGLPAWWALLEQAAASLALGEAARAELEAEQAHRRASLWASAWAQAEAGVHWALAKARLGDHAGAQALQAEWARVGPQAQRQLPALEAELAAWVAPLAGGLGASGLSAGAMALAASAIAAAPDESAIGRALLAAGQGLLGAETGFFLSYEGGRLRRAIGLGLDADAESAEGFSRTVVAQVLAQAAPLVWHDAQKDLAGAASVAALSLRTVVGLPVATVDSLVGVLVLHREALEPLIGPEELGALEALASAGAEAILAKRRLDAAQGEAFALGALGQRLAGLLPPLAVAAAALGTAMEACGAERGFLLGYDALGEPWVALALGGDGQALKGADARPSMGLAKHLLNSGSPLAMLDAGDAAALGAGASVASLGLRAAWGLPLPEGGALLLDTTEIQLADPAAALGPLGLLVEALAPHLALGLLPPSA